MTPQQWINQGIIYRRIKMNKSLMKEGVKYMLGKSEYDPEKREVRTPLYIKHNNEALRTAKRILSCFDGIKIPFFNSLICGDGTYTICQSI